MKARLETAEEKAARRARPKTCDAMLAIAHQRGGERYTGDHRKCGEPAVIESPLGTYLCRSCAEAER